MAGTGFDDSTRDETTERDSKSGVVKVVGRMASHLFGLAERVKKRQEERRHLRAGNFEMQFDAAHTLNKGGEHRQKWQVMHSDGHVQSEPA